jgi:hypothetical protein
MTRKSEMLLSQWYKRSSDLSVMKFLINVCVSLPFCHLVKNLHFLLFYMTFLSKWFTWLNTIYLCPIQPAVSKDECFLCYERIQLSGLTCISSYSSKIPAHSPQWCGGVADHVGPQRLTQNLTYPLLSAPFSLTGPTRVPAWP